MSPVMVYVPLSYDEARRLRDSGSLDGPVAAHAATAGLLRAHDLTADAEDAEYTALAYAGVAALLGREDPLRLVIAAELRDEPTGDDPYDPFGRVETPGLSWASVSSVFADADDSVQRIAQARELAAGLNFEQCVDAEQIEALLDDSDLLWFAPSELAQLIDPNA